MLVVRVARYYASFFTLAAMLVLITPLCGLLFDCGCTWPWQGFESHCNIHNPEAAYQCPWCVSSMAGILSCGLAVLVGFLLAIKPIKSGYDIRGSALVGFQQASTAPEFTKRVLVGLLGFTVVAAITGWISGYIQGYPYFFVVSGLSV